MHKEHSDIKLNFDKNLSDLLDFYIENKILSAGQDCPEFKFANHEFNYKKYAGYEELYNTEGVTQFIFLLKQGLTPNCNLLDVGCGPLRAGRFLIKYLNNEKYIGIEPAEQILKQAIKKQKLFNLFEIKKPKFFHNYDFNLDNIPIQNFIVAFDVFFHCGIEQLKTFLKNLHKVCDEKTKIIITVQFADGDPHESLKSKGLNVDYFYPHASHVDVYYDIDQFKNIALGFGFEASLFSFKKDIPYFYSPNPKRGGRLIFLLNKK